MFSKKIDVLTTMYVAAKHEWERAMKGCIVDSDVYKEYQQDLIDMEELYDELFRKIRNEEKENQLF